MSTNSVRQSAGTVYHGNKVYFLKTYIFVYIPVKHSIHMYGRKIQKAIQKDFIKAFKPHCSEIITHKPQTISSVFSGAFVLLFTLHPITIRCQVLFASA